MTLTSSAPIDSPCVRNCCLNDEDICLGCGRSLGEITRWSAANSADKLVILTAAEERRRLIRVRQSAPT
jgi:predicted Fe-S protein YdhL (DUF1289 family)